MQLSEGKLWSLRRLADENRRFKIVAIDQRSPIMNPIKSKTGVATVGYGDVAAIKALLTRTSDRVLRSDAIDYLRDINRPTDASASSCQSHEAFGQEPTIRGASPDFSNKYKTSARLRNASFPAPSGLEDAKFLERPLPIDQL